ncbi:MAG: DUF1080 domain-containing protein [Pirellulaceae bacterium]|nr:DUF1080 domain-containing protein [Pirellulaceae bacterium]
MRPWKWFIAAWLAGTCWLGTARAGQPPTGDRAAAGKPATEKPATEKPAAGQTDTGQANADEAPWRELFDGKSLEGWEGNPRMFRVERQAIVAGSLQQPIPHNEFLCTREQFEDFELELQARLVGRGDNAGIQFRSQRIPDHHEVIGYQCDMGSLQGRPIWGALYDESRRRRMLAEGDAQAVKQAYRPGEWNQFRIRCQGPRVQIWLNGVQTVDYTETDDQIARRGIIGLQIHGGAPAEASYRQIRLRTLPSGS